MCSIAYQYIRQYVNHYVNQYNQYVNLVIHNVKKGHKYVLETVIVHRLLCAAVHFNVSVNKLKCYTFHFQLKIANNNITYKLHNI